MMPPIIKYLGPLHGKVLLFGGVYSNLQALDGLMNVARALAIPPGNVICTGDIVGYCAEPEACIQRIRDWGIHSIAGNVEIQLRAGETDCGCNFDGGSRCDLLSRQWYPFAQEHLSAESIEWMRGLPDHIDFDYAYARMYVVHGSWFNISEFVFRSTPWDRKAANFKQTEADVMIGGHCGLPFHHSQNGRLWLNPGVIGMPANDGTPRVWYMLLDDSIGHLTFHHRSFTYDHETAAGLMEQKGLPRAYSETLRSGIWDNCDILPPTETEAQGLVLEW